MKTKYNPLAFLNLFKLIAAIIIAVFVHLTKSLDLYQLNTPVFSFLKNRGVMLVEFFFLVSGMLYAIAYHSKLRDQQISFGVFILKRIKRIWPAMAVSIVYIFVFKIIYYGLKGSISLDFTSLIVSLAFGTSTLITGDTSYVINGAAWYIGVLMFCYVVASLFSFLQGKLKTGKWIFSIPIIIFVPILLLKPVFPFFNYESARGVISFFLGFYLMFLVKEIANLKNVQRICVKIACFIAFCFFVFLQIYPGIIQKNLNGLVFVLTIYFPLIICCYDSKHINNICSNKVVSALGATSFYIYIFNDSIHRTWFAVFDPSMSITNSWGAWYLLIDTIAHLLLGLMLFFLFEKLPIIIKSKIKKKHVQL